VVLNLIVNGVEAAAEQPPSNRWVLVQTRQLESGNVEITVEDSGKGIIDGDMHQIFEPFFSTKRESLGMGLSISRSIVLAHDGQLWAENRTGAGGIFRCVLPVAQHVKAASVE
jgi:signal transduction histidine kinase